MPEPVVICQVCDHEVPCYHMDKHGRVRVDAGTWAEAANAAHVSAQTPVHRCPNANDSCTYPDCPHQLMEPQVFDKPKFKRETTGDALTAMALTIAQLTYPEMMRFANGIGAKPEDVDLWAQRILNPPPPNLPEANNDNAKPGVPSLDPTAGLIPTAQVQP